MEKTVAPSCVISPASSAISMNWPGMMRPAGVGMRNNASPPTMRRSTTRTTGW